MSTGSEYRDGFVIGLFLGMAFIFVILFVWQYAVNKLKKLKAEIQDEATKAAIAASNRTVQDSVRDITENILADSEKKVQNDVVLPSDASTKPDKPPFWNDLSALEAAKERIEAAHDVPHDIAELGAATNHEAWRKLDARILELQIASDPSVIE